MQIHGHVGEVPNHTQTLDMIEVRMGQQDACNLIGSPLDGLDHVECCGTWIHDHTLAAGFAPYDVAVLGEVTTRKAAQSHTGFFHFPRKPLPSKQKARGTFTHELSVAGLVCVVQVVKELPHPHPPVAFGFRNVKPDPIMLVV